jgi:hypothetical protein
MSIVERLYAPISERPSPDAAIDAFDIKDHAIALRWRAGSAIGSQQQAPITPRRF